MNRNRRRLLIGAFSLAAAALVAWFATWFRQGPRKVAAGERKRPPKRPPGRPKPVLEEDLGPTLRRLDAWYAAHLPPDRYAFNPPATDAQLDAFERLTGIKLPRSYRQLYRWHDGEDDDRAGHIYGLPILSLHEAASQWMAWNRVLAEFKGDRYKIRASSWPPGAVDPAYINRYWIPLTHDGAGNHIGLDFDPWPRGRVGQVILFGRDQDVKAVLAPSLGKFLEWIAGLLESGNFRLEPEPNRLREFRLKTPEADGFDDGARKLLGAPGPFL